MRVTIQLTGKAFLPEAWAYRNALTAAGHLVSVVEPSIPISETDPAAVLRFAGLIRTDKRRSYAEIHGYNNVSRTSLPRTKNFIKKGLAGHPDARIFVTDWVRNELRFKDGVPSIVREMGASPELISAREASERPYDVVYCGSITGRQGLIQMIKKLSLLGYRTAIAGNATAKEARFLSSIQGVKFFGLLSHTEVPQFLSQGSLGLHFCPDKYPFKYEFGSKVVEYLAAGLPVVSNKYHWIDQHSSQEGYSYLDIKTLEGVDKIAIPPNAVIPVNRARNFTWPEVLERAQFVRFVEEVFQRSEGLK